ncbi:hypothetical protein WL29_20770 [Burkholderia ubonensis]|uniref:Uncharacterized protein n=1 Tax=Burkholderia ubonensis TaxID=101571 RepID=A0A106QB78_9BURK|nr:hypothetical protein [Burkholderia ubonensis]KWA83800.1 hypothetical protein WL29_20770 [Burkholderia ubonensis]
MDRSEALAATALFVCISVLTIWGVAAEKQNEERHLQDLAIYKVEPEYIKTRGLQPPSEFQSVSTGPYSNGKGFAYGGSVTTYWVMAETDDWVLFNGPRGTEICQPVLGNFGYINARSEVLSAAQVRLLAAGFKEKPVELQVLVPRFKSMPPNLERCSGFSYDVATGLLKVGDKRIAYLTESQPRLAQPANTQ